MVAPLWALEQVRGRGDLELARIAAEQKGLVVREQLLAAGFGRGAIAHRLQTGRLRERYRGVYLVDRAALEPLGEEMAAVLHFRGYAILSHRSAAWLWGLVAQKPDEVTLTIVGKSGRARHGVRVHRVTTLDRSDVRVRNGLPLTSPAQTVVDLAAEASDGELEDAVAIAQMRGLARQHELRAALERAPRRKGIARLRRLIETGAASGYTRSKAERRLRTLLRAAELPQPRANVPLLGYVADFLWPDEKLVLEVDGWGSHSSRSSFENDRRRDQRLTAAGYVVVRVTWRQLLDEPFAVVARLAQVLARS